MNDEYLVEMCLEGDVRAFAALAYRYPVYDIYLSYTRDFDAAEDAAKKALISAHP